MRSSLTQTRIFAAFAAAIVLGMAGKFLVGWSGLLLGLAGGAAAGWFGASLPRKYLHQRIARDLAELPVFQLRGEMKGENWPVFHLYYRELYRRGEDLSAELPRVLEFLEAEDPDQRREGWQILESCFPGLASKIRDFQPDDSQEACRSRVALLRRAKT